MAPDLEISEKSGKVKRAKIVREMSENLRKKVKSGNLSRMSERKIFTIT